MNITLSIDEKLITKAREIARTQGKSVNRMIRDYLASLSDRQDGSDPARELFDIMDKGRGSLGGKRWSRDEIHAR